LNIVRLAARDVTKLGSWFGEGAEGLKLDRGRRKDRPEAKPAAGVTVLDQPMSEFCSDIARVLPYLREKICFKIPSDIAYLDQVLDYLNQCLLKLGVTNPEDSEVLVALDEAIVNAIKHGNGSDPNKSVHIMADISPRGARFTVRDEGAGFTCDNIPDPTDPLRLLLPCGRGLLLINHIMDRVTHNKAGNEIRMIRRVRRHRQA
jgi:serine/threonine-protein kinase RsbW